MENIELKPDAWPNADLEVVEKCPACGGTEQETLHRGLKDLFFNCAPGIWNMSKCIECGTGYLNPRPTANSIMRAYAKYYTHTDPDTHVHNNVSKLSKVLRSWANGYRARRFGAPVDSDASPFGGAMIAAIGPIARYLDANMRHLDRSGGKGKSVLDVGCGSGRFIKAAAELGWKAVGIDPDEKAVQTARNSGADASTRSLKEMVELGEKFDLITSAHVLEHVYDPDVMLAEMFALLKPGGRLWLETPNINALGHDRFGEYWRGLEAPRHLAIFNPGSLSEMLRRAGFLNVTFKSRGFGTAFTYMQSFNALKESRSMSRMQLLYIMVVDAIRQELSEKNREFLTIVAERGR